MLPDPSQHRLSHPAGKSSFPPSLLDLTFHRATLDMKFTWDEQKRYRNLFAHGLDFEDAKRIFNGLEWSCEDRRFHYREQRYRTIGLLDGKPVTVIHTFEEDHVHVISFRKATRHQSTEYFATFPKLD
jgi:uncharacterized DUF497 family protein